MVSHAYVECYRSEAVAALSAERSTPMTLVHRDTYSVQQQAFQLQAPDESHGDHLGFSAASAAIVFRACKRIVSKGEAANAECAKIDGSRCLSCFLYVQ